MLIKCKSIPEITTYVILLFLHHHFWVQSRQWQYAVLVKQSCFGSLGGLLVSLWGQLRLYWDYDLQDHTGLNTEVFGQAISVTKCLYRHLRTFSQRVWRRKNNFNNGKRVYWKCLMGVGRGGKTKGKHINILAEGYLL